MTCIFNPGIEKDSVFKSCNTHDTYRASHLFSTSSYTQHPTGCLTCVETGIMWIAASWSYGLSDALACQQHYLLHQCGSLVHHRRWEMERFQTGPFKSCQVHWQFNINETDSAKCLLIKSGVRVQLCATWHREALPKVISLPMRLFFSSIWAGSCSTETYFYTQDWRFNTFL